MQERSEQPSNIQEALSVDSTIPDEVVDKMFTGPILKKPTDTIKGGTDWAIEDPKFNGFGGKHPQIDR